jgi:hypothetical protein
VPHRFQKSDTVHAVNLLPDQSRIAKLPPRCVPRLLLRHPTRKIFRRLKLQISVNLAFPLRVPLTPVKKPLPGHFRRSSAKGYLKNIFWIMFDKTVQSLFMTPHYEEAYH